MLYCRSHQGIALIQVLLITAILSVLALFLTTTAREQVKIAQWSSDKTQALFDLQSSQAQLLFELLTKNKISSANANDQDKAYSTVWNFYGEPFYLQEHIKIKLQDQSALLHAYFPNEQRLKLLINLYTDDEGNTNKIYDALLDWQDLDSISRLNGDESLRNLDAIRNGSVPSVKEFYLVNRINTTVADALVNNMTIYRKGFFNPMNASHALLTALTNSTVAEQVINLRAAKQLTPRKFTELTGIIEDQRTLFYPSNFISIEIESTVGESSVNKKIVVELSPYAPRNKHPVNILSQE